MNKFEARAVSSGKIRQYVTQGYLLRGLSRAVRFCGALIFNHQPASAAQHVTYQRPGSHEQVEPAHLQIIENCRYRPSADIANLIQ